MIVVVVLLIVLVLSAGTVGYQLGLDAPRHRRRDIVYNWGPAWTQPPERNVPGEGVRD